VYITHDTQLYLITLHYCVRFMWNQTVRELNLIKLKLCHIWMPVEHSH